MLKLVLIALVTLVIIFCAYFVFLSLTSKPVYTGIVDGKLGPCSDKPNCVNSERGGDKSIDPISLEKIPTGEIWNKVCCSGTGKWRRNYRSERCLSES